MTKSNNAYNLYLICSGELKLPFSIFCQKGNQNLYIGTVKVYKHERGKIIFNNFESNLVLKHIWAIYELKLLRN